MATPNAATSQNMLLFIPDISGYTRFVKETEMAHSRHIIEELLECLIDNNELGLTVSELEGDAILFYRAGVHPRPVNCWPRSGGCSSPSTRT